MVYRNSKHNVYTSYTHYNVIGVKLLFPSAHTRLWYYRGSVRTGYARMKWGQSRWGNIIIIIIIELLLLIWTTSVLRGLINSHRKLWRRIKRLFPGVIKCILTRLVSLRREVRRLPPPRPQDSRWKPKTRFRNTCN